MPEAYAAPFFDALSPADRERPIPFAVHATLRDPSAEPGLRSLLADVGAVDRLRLVRLISKVDPSVRSVIGELGQRSDYSAQKAQTLLGWSPRPARESVLDCARGIQSHGAGRPDVVAH